MAVLAAAQLLDELMGRNRNLAPSDKTKELNWEDSEVSLRKICNYKLALVNCKMTHQVLMTFYNNFTDLDQMYVVLGPRLMLI